MIKISVIITSYNYSRYLAHCIDSVLAQSYKNYELIVVDDCSTDSSHEIIRSYHNKIVPVLHNTNKGHGAAFNSGFEKASGQIVTFLDADDYLLEHALEKLNNAFDDNIAQYQYRMHLVNEFSEQIDIYPQPQTPLDSGMLQDKLISRGRYETTVTSGLAFSRKALKSVMPVDEICFRQGGDGFLVSSIPFYGLVYSIEEPLSAYRIHTRSHSKFSENLLHMAQWRINHDKERYRIIRKHAQLNNLETEEPLGYSDTQHLEQKMTIALLGKNKQQQKESRQQIAHYGLGCMHLTPHRFIRKYAVYLWWLLLGYTPKPIAIRILSWKLNGQSRPKIIKLIAKIVRHA